MFLDGTNITPRQIEFYLKSSNEIHVDDNCPSFSTLPKNSWHLVPQKEKKKSTLLCKFLSLVDLSLH